MGGISIRRPGRRSIVFCWKRSHESPWWSAFLSTRRSSARCAARAGRSAPGWQRYGRGGGTITISMSDFPVRVAAPNVTGKRRRRRATAAAGSSIGGSRKKRFTRPHQDRENRCAWSICRWPVPHSSLHPPHTSCSFRARLNEAVGPATAKVPVREGIPKPDLARGQCFDRRLAVPANSHPTNENFGGDTENRTIDESRSPDFATGVTRERVRLCGRSSAGDRHLCALPQYAQRSSNTPPIKPALSSLAQFSSCERHAYEVTNGESQARGREPQNELSPSRAPDCHSGEDSDRGAN